MEPSTSTTAPEKLVPSSLDQIKNHTKALKRELSRCDVNIAHSSLLHVVSKAFDFENYHAAEAILGKSPKTPRRLKKNKSTPETEGEEFDLLMTAIRKEIGDVKFNYAMRIHPIFTGIDSNPLETLNELGYYHCNFETDRHVADGKQWMERYKHAENGRRIYEGQSEYLNEQLEQIPSLSGRLQDIMPTEKDASDIKLKAFVNVKRNLMLTGITGSATVDTVARWCTYGLGYDYVPIKQAVSLFLSEPEITAWQNNTLKENVHDIIAIFIYAKAVYDALIDPKQNFKSIAADWLQFVQTKGGRDEIVRLLSGRNEFMHLMNDGIALVLNMDYDDALKLINDSCIYRLDEIEYKDLIFQKM